MLQIQLDLHVQCTRIMIVKINKFISLADYLDSEHT